MKADFVKRRFPFFRKVGRECVMTQIFFCSPFDSQYPIGQSHMFSSMRNNGGGVPSMVQMFDYYLDPYIFYSSDLYNCLATVL